MESKHTPGPWIAYEDAIYQERPHGELSPLICDTINGRTITGEEREANARLIAAAPDLLAALEELVELFGPFHHTDAQYMPRMRAIAAIAKAEGKEVPANG